MGVEAMVTDDGLQIHPPKNLRGAEIDPHDDHRMAMSFALAGLTIDGVTISNPRCVAKSMPDYFEYLKMLV
jgi:3-phosphoshikimate 1-carboxyvinyltransferase